MRAQPRKAGWLRFSIGVRMITGFLAVILITGAIVAVAAVSIVISCLAKDMIYRLRWRRVARQALGRTA